MKLLGSLALLATLGSVLLAACGDGSEDPSPVATGGSAGTATGGSAGTATGGSAGTATGGSAGTATGGSAGMSGDGASDDVGDRTDYNAITLTEGNAYSSNSTGVSNTNYSFASTAGDTPAVKVAAGGGLTLRNSKVAKSGDTSSEDNSNFYGVNAGLLVSSSGSATGYSASSAASADVQDSTITTSSEGSNGAFSFGANATLVLDHVTINTTGNSSRGVDATYGGALTLTNSVITTQGDHCGALATDRYNGTSAPTIQATNVRGTTAGQGSPGIYCTGKFTVDHATLTATNSEAAAIEGKNSITLTHSVLSGNAKWGVMIYQSMSGDSSVGTGSFSMTGGQLTNGAASGPMFFVCNTEATIALEGASLVNASGTLLVAGTNTSVVSVCGIPSSNVQSSWSGKGGIVTLTATDQTLKGDLRICDTSSSLTLTLASSTLSGAINGDGIDTTVAVTLDAGSIWEVTGDSHLSVLTNNGSLTGAGKVYVSGTQVYP